LVLQLPCHLLLLLLLVHCLQLGLSTAQEPSEQHLAEPLEWLMRNPPLQIGRQVHQMPVLLVLQQHQHCSGQQPERCCQHYWQQRAAQQPCYCCCCAKQLDLAVPAPQKLQQPALSLAAVQLLLPG
jgi:hypothetical protein